MMSAGALLLLAGLWLAATALLVRSQLNQVRADAHTLGSRISASNWAGARATANDLAAHAHRAHQLTSGPVGALAAALPSGGEPLQIIRGITAGVDSLGREALPKLVAASERLNPRTLRRPDGSIDVARFTAIAPAVSSASATPSRSRTRRRPAGPAGCQGPSRYSKPTTARCGSPVWKATRRSLGSRPR